MLKKHWQVITIGLLIAALFVSCTTHEGVYVGPEMQTDSGGRYFCTFETKDVFYEYMQSR
jgi:hypothetical protein